MDKLEMYNEVYLGLAATTLAVVCVLAPVSLFFMARTMHQSWNWHRWPPWVQDPPPPVVEVLWSLEAAGQLNETMAFTCWARGQLRDPATLAHPPARAELAAAVERAVAGEVVPHLAVDQVRAVVEARWRSSGSLEEEAAPAPLRDAASQGGGLAEIACVVSVAPEVRASALRWQLDGERDRFRAALTKAFNESWVSPAVSATTALEVVEVSPIELQVRPMFDDGDGQASLDEFAHATGELEEPLEYRKAAVLFQGLDVDQDGFVSSAEFAAILSDQVVTTTTATATSTTVTQTSTSTRTTTSTTLTATVSTTTTATTTALPSFAVVRTVVQGVDWHSLTAGARVGMAGAYRGGVARGASADAKDIMDASSRPGCVSTRPLDGSAVGAELLSCFHVPRGVGSRAVTLVFASDTERSVLLNDLSAAVGSVTGIEVNVAVTQDCFDPTGSGGWKSYCQNGDETGAVQMRIEGLDWSALPNPHRHAIAETYRAKLGQLSGLPSALVTDNLGHPSCISASPEKGGDGRLGVVLEGCFLLPRKASLKDLQALAASADLWENVTKDLWAASSAVKDTRTADAVAAATALDPAGLRVSPQTSAVCGTAGGAQTQASAPWGSYCTEAPRTADG